MKNQTSQSPEFFLQKLEAIEHEMRKGGFWAKERSIDLPYPYAFVDIEFDEAPEEGIPFRGYAIVSRVIIDSI